MHRFWWASIGIAVGAGRVLINTSFLVTDFHLKILFRYIAKIKF